MKVALVRHPPPAIAAGTCYGRLDVPLRVEAAATVPAVAARLAAEGFARAWSSPARRCAVVADALGLPVRLDARLRELDFGVWEGLAWAAVPRAALDAWAADPLGFAPPGGESGAALLARVQAVLADLRAAGEDCVVVSHGGPLKLFGALLRGASPDLLAPAPALGSVEILTA